MHPEATLKTRWQKRMTVHYIIIHELKQGYIKYYFILEMIQHALLSKKKLAKQFSEPCTQEK